MHLAPALEPLGGAPRTTMDAVAAAGYRFAQLSATQPGLRPRELDRSARRDLMATMRRRELEPSGIDLWIPPAHFTEPQSADRAVAAALEAVDLGADLGGYPVSMTLPRGADDVITAIAAAARRQGVLVADHARPVEQLDDPIGVGIDPLLWQDSDDDPASAVLEHAARLVSARLGGRLDVQRYRVALSVAAYARHVVLDAREWPDPWDGLQRTTAAWNAAAASSQERL